MKPDGPNRNPSTQKKNGPSFFILHPASFFLRLLSYCPRPATSNFAKSAWRTYSMVAALVVLWAIFAYVTDSTFLTARNFSNLMRQTTITAILAVGMLMVIVTGQIDLSVGSVVGLTGGLTAIAQAWLGWGLWASLAMGLTTGLAVGAVQGLFVAYANIPAFIVTLGGLLAWRGAIKGLSKGNTIPINLASFKAIGQDYMPPAIGWALALLAMIALGYFMVRRHRARLRYGIVATRLGAVILSLAWAVVLILAFTGTLNAYAGVPIPVIIWLAVALSGAFLTQQTIFGRYLFAIGGNPEAARLSGINLRRHLLAVFCIMGALTGVAGIIYTARVGAASPDAGRLLELDAIAACVIGGASLMGGRGTVLGACLGALFMASLDNGMSLKNVPDFTQDIVKGAILVTAVGLDVWGRERS
ncbi:MAG: sugar ABC transporter permease [Acidobacteria bacterium]|nr:sugar ABC transporter permease [Acidobacteriota bacterium]MBI3655878.1 sugar ABC transporter permease [Acidobacteriota bacterium]